MSKHPKDFDPDSLETEEVEQEEWQERMNIIVDKGQAALRIDKFLMARIEGASRSKIQQAIANKMVTVNGELEKANYKVRAEDVVIVYELARPESQDIIPQDIPINIVYEDDHVMVVNKVAGMVVHPGSGNKDGTLLNAVAGYWGKKNIDAELAELPRLGLVHRIDKNTTGLLVIAKTKEAMTHLAKQFSDHTVHRRYIALVWGNFDEPSGTIRAHVGRHQRFRKLFTTYPEGDYGKDAITHYKVLENFNYTTLVECRLETGRTHQIRVHMQSIGHPLFNDDFYGGDRVVKGTVYTKYKQFVENCFKLCQRQALHAKELGFIHPHTGEQMLFESDMPEDMELAIDKWRKYVLNKNVNE